MFVTDRLGRYLRAPFREDMRPIRAQWSRDRGTEFFTVGDCVYIMHARRSYALVRDREGRLVYSALLHGDLARTDDLVADRPVETPVCIHTRFQTTAPLAPAHSRTPAPTTASPTTPSPTPSPSSPAQTTKIAVTAAITALAIAVAAAAR